MSSKRQSLHVRTKKMMMTLDALGMSYRMMIDNDQGLLPFVNKLTHSKYAAVACSLRSVVGYAFIALLS